MSDSNWFQVRNDRDVPSPALLIFVERVEENIRRMLRLCPAERLRPHMKTHKVPKLIQMQLAHGITRFKCATIAEAEMVAASGAPDVLLAYQPVGPNIERLIALAKKFPQAKFATILDNPATLQALGKAATGASCELEVLLDLDCGMHRCGIEPGETAAELYRLLTTTTGLRPGGLHAYDGHLHQSNVAERAAACEIAFAQVEKFRAQLESAGLPVPRIVAGGTPTFPMHARRGHVECSPGTCVLWDHGYGTKLPDLDFLPAAVLLTRVISQPAAHRICLDLGHKAVASEMPHPRAWFPQLPDAKPVMHSEEHLVLETNQAANFAVGTVLYGIPWHICPTMALHSQVEVVKNSRVTERWRVVARDRVLSV
ncbi:MAG: D-TA family PLP-dependent enzyme [Verrucomicrobiota bacterium]